MPGSGKAVRNGGAQPRNATRCGLVEGLREIGELRRWRQGYPVGRSVEIPKDVVPVPDQLQIHGWEYPPAIAGGSLSLRRSNDRLWLAGFLRRPGRRAAADGLARSSDETAAAASEFFMAAQLRIKSARMQCAGRRSRAGARLYPWSVFTCCERRRMPEPKLMRPLSAMLGGETGRGRTEAEGSRTIAAAGRGRSSILSRPETVFE